MCYTMATKELTEAEKQQARLKLAKKNRGQLLVQLAVQAVHVFMALVCSADDAQTQVYEAMERRDASEVQWVTTRIARHTGLTCLRWQGKRALVLRKRYRRTDDKEIAENARVQKMKERLDEIAAASAAGTQPRAPSLTQWPHLCARMLSAVARGAASSVRAEGGSGGQDAR